MALIQCPECGKMISDTSNVCIGCGYKFKKQKVYNFKLNNKIIAIISIIISILIIISAALCFFNFHLSEDEKYALENVQDLKNHLKDPSSLQLYDDILVIHYIDDKSLNLCGIYTFIDYGAKNSFGATVSDLAAYKSYEYLESINYEVKGEDITNATGSEMEKIKQIIQAQVIYYSVQLNFKGTGKISGEGIKSYTLVKKEKILKHLKN